MKGFLTYETRKGTKELEIEEVIPIVHIDGKIKAIVMFYPDMDIETANILKREGCRINFEKDKKQFDVQCWYSNTQPYSENMFAFRTSRSL